MSTQNSFVAASGYGQLDAGILGRIGYWQGVLDLKCYEDASWPSWTNTEVDGDILERFQVVKFTVADEPTPFRPYEKNQQLVDDEISAYEVCAQMCFAEYVSEKVNDLDMFRQPELLDQFMNNRQMKRMSLYGETLNERVLARFLAEADPLNQGPNAGFVTRSNNLGTSTTPVSLANPAEIPKFLGRMQAVAMETKCFGRGQGWHLVIPNQMNTALYQTVFANKFDLGACSELVCQNLQGNLPAGTPGPYGWRWWTNLGLSKPNASGAVPVILFHDAAQIFASRLVQNRIYPGEDFDHKFQMLLVSGGKVLHPERVVVGWVSFQ
jgi:hypothetical protein